jgi:hypothetical protein
MCVCLFLFVRRRCGAVYGVVALAFPLATVAFQFSFEARPYGLVCGFAGLALVCWQAACEEPRPRFALAGLALSLTAAIYSHYYAVFLFVPFLLGELVRRLERRRLDWAMLAALGVPLVAPVLLLPLFEGTRSYSAYFWAKPSWADVTGSYYELISPLTYVLALVLAGLVVYPERRPWTVAPPSLPARDVAVALGFAAIPVAGVVAALTVTRVFSVRYVLPTTLGLSLLLAFAAYRRAAGSVLVGGVLALVLLGFWGRAEVQSYRQVTAERDRWETTYAFLEKHGTGEGPLVIANPLEYLPAQHGAPPTLRGRFVYLSDIEASAQHVGKDTTERALRKLALVTPLRVEEYRKFVADRKGATFLVYGDNGWLFKVLEHDGARIKLVAEHEGARLVRVQVP